MRNDSVSIAKGVAIILMVLAHTRFSVYGGQLINMFHMPLFFFFSGYCFKALYLDDAKGFALKRLKGIYRPYLLWSLLFLALHNVFYRLNLYNGAYGFEGQASVLYSAADFKFHALKIATALGGHDQLLGGYWFLHSLFFGSFIAYACLWLRYKFGRFRGLKPLETWTIILLICCALCLYLNISVPWLDVGSKEFLAAFFIVAGHWYRQKDFHWEGKWYALLAGALLLLAGSRFWQASMLSLRWQQTLPYALTALCGTLLVLALSGRIAAGHHFFKRFMVFAGDHSLQILTWHFLSFKLVSLLIISLYHLPIEQLAEFPVVKEFAVQGWWVVYLVAGVALPLCLAALDLRNIFRIFARQIKKI